MKKYKLSASILNANFGKLEKEISVISKYVDEFHLDVMDGHFVPNISFGPGVVEVIRKKTKLPLDVHLMISEPEKYVDKFIDAGADMITIHSEVVRYFPCLDKLKNKNVKIGVAYSPDTKPTFINNSYVSLDKGIDRILIMSVYPGFGGQKFIDSVLGKISDVREYVDKHGYDVEVAIDGGVKQCNAYDVAKHGADIIVCGTSIVKGNKRKNVRGLKKAIDKWYKKKKL